MHENGNFAACILPRMIAGKYGYVGGNIQIQVPKRAENIALFGEADEITITFLESARIKEITIVSLLDDKYEKLKTEKERIVVTKEMIRKLWHSKDKSLSSIVLRINYVKEVDSSENI